MKTQGKPEKVSALFLLKGYEWLQNKANSYFISSKAAIYTDEKHQLKLSLV